MKYLILLILPLLMLAGCVEMNMFEAPGAVTVPVIVNDNGISVGVSDIQINNLRESATIEVIYAIHNGTADILKPSIYYNFNINPKDYEKASNYVLCPEIARGWLTINSPKEISVGATDYCHVKLETPQKIKEKIPDKYTFRVGIAGNSGGLFQTAVETWWLVDMR